jgi:hypothetical protein
MLHLKEVKALGLVKLVQSQVVDVVHSEVVSSREEDNTKVEGVILLNLNREVVVVVDMGNHHNSNNSMEDHKSTKEEEEEDLLIKEVEEGMAVAVEVDLLLDHRRDNQFPSCIKLPHLLIKRCLLSLHCLR